MKNPPNVVKVVEIDISDRERLVCDVEYSDPMGYIPTFIVNIETLSLTIFSEALNGDIDGTHALWADADRRNKWIEKIKEKAMNDWFQRNEYFI